MKEILLATGNKRKIVEARASCDNFGIKLVPVLIDINEIQHHDPIKIAVDKAKRAYEQTNKPVVVTDTSWNIPSLNGFPGGYMKEVAQWFVPEDFINLVKLKNDNKISFVETVVYQDSKETKVFSEEYWGTISDSPRGNGNSIEQVAEFNNYTIGERMKQNKTSHDPEDYVWYKFAQWFSDKNNN